MVTGIVGSAEPIEDVGCTVEDFAVKRFQAAPHGRRRVRVPEDTFNVEEVEQVATVGGGSPVEDACGGAAEVVGLTCPRLAWAARRASRMSHPCRCRATHIRH